MSKPLFQYTKQEESCPQCGSPLQIKQGKKGPFFGCSAYPHCDFIKPLHNQNESGIIRLLEQHCPECDHPLALKQGQFGIFIGCSAYPDCRFIVHEREDNATEGEAVICPACAKSEMVARRGRQGKYFYACRRFPHCKFTLPSQPYAQDCPYCGYRVAMLKKQKETRRIWQCANKSCRRLFETE
ncbi:putative DNA topoisomerase [Mesocricetibacter intestinalis]|uniref:Putative DNA topoisomerase n=1 Tax=Mesocricetibacter intestinalis TaxID=1521930 RepID=A0A4R6V9X3_9PAST|nr:type I DNA topoisomerase [Mesocricetibacter intestinalis]TDQ56641.1 putative DNA topoisomerase [Mesocricetibacter intestinalis]